MRENVWLEVKRWKKEREKGKRKDKKKRGG